MRSPDFNIAFSIGSFHVYWYAILLALGIAVAMFISDRRARSRQIPKDIALDLCILGVPFGVLGARLFACLGGEVAWANFFDLTRPGLSFFGGLASAALAILVYLRLRKVPVGEMTDIAAPGAFAGLAVAVWGDFFNRTNYGPLVEKAAHKWFPLATIGDDLAIHYAAFFYEFLLCVALVALYYALLQKRIQRKGGRFPLMVLLFCLGRFCIDSIRMHRTMLGPIALDQVWELCLALISLVCLVVPFRPKASVESAAESPVPEPAQEEPTIVPDPEPRQEDAGLQ